MRGRRLYRSRMVARRGRMSSLALAPGMTRTPPEAGPHPHRSESRSKMGTRHPPTKVREDLRAFGAYVRLLRENFYGKGRGKRLRQLSRETGIAPSVLSRGERGLQDLRQVEYIGRLAAGVGGGEAVPKRVAALAGGRDGVC